MNTPPAYDSLTNTVYTGPTTGLKPYLELNHLYTLSWLAYPILSLLFVAFSLIASSDTIAKGVDSAKSSLLSSCAAAEKAATTTASLPRYLAVATNEQYADAVNATLRAARATLILALTIMEAIINFIIDIYQSTLLCFLELVVRGGLAILQDAVEALNSVVHDAAQGIQSTLTDSISGANSAIQSALDAINKVNPFDDITIGQIAQPDLSALSNVTLPSSISDAISNLNASIPSVAELKQGLQDIVDTPFELLKVEINDTFAGISYNSSMMPVPVQNSVSFCSDMDTGVIDDLGRDLLKMVKIGILILIFVALILIALNCALEKYKWKSTERHFESTREAWSTDPAVYQMSRSRGAPTMALTNHNMLMLRATSSHPVITRFVNSLSRRMGISANGNINLTWFLHYIFHPAPLTCFLVGFIGILAVQVQLWAIGPLEAKYSNQVASSVNDFSNTIASSINSSMYNQSASYAEQVNADMAEIQQKLDDGMFGWVNTTTTTLNDTISHFYSQIEDVVGTVFNGTVLEKPANDFLYCILGTKVDAVENALTFLNENLVVKLPQMNNSALMLNQADIDEASKPIAQAAVGSSSGDDNDSVVGKLVNSYVSSLYKQRLMYGIFLALWCFVVLMGLCFILWHTYGRGMMEERRRRQYQEGQAAVARAYVVPFTAGLLPPPPIRDVAEKSDANRSFSPTPSPPKRNWFSFNREPSAWRSDSEKSPKANAFSDAPRADQGAQKWAGLLKNPAMKLTALNRKGRGREVLVPDSTPAEQQPIARDGSEHSDGWYGRLFDRRVGDSKPDLRIVVDNASDMKPNAVVEVDDQQQSRWSPSPVREEAPAKSRASFMPWLRVTTPSSGSASDKSLSLPPNNNLLFPPPPQRPTRRAAPTVPVDVQSENEEPTAPAPFAPPLHYATIQVGQIMPAPAPPPTKPMPPPPAAPMQSFGLNPFLTPFDDEHHVKTVDEHHVKTVDQSPTARRSIATNPFVVI